MENLELAADIFWQPAYKARLLRHHKSGSPLLKHPQTWQPAVK